MTRAAVAGRLRGLTSADRVGIEAITVGTGLFRDDEVPVALEVFDAAPLFERLPRCRPD